MDKTELIQMNEELTERVEALEEALKPFANRYVLEVAETRKKKDTDGVDFGVTVLHLRRAVEVYYAESEEANGEPEDTEVVPDEDLDDDEDDDD